MASNETNIIYFFVVRPIRYPLTLPLKREVGSTRNRGEGEG